MPFCLALTFSYAANAFPFDSEVYKSPFRFPGEEGAA